VFLLHMNLDPFGRALWQAVFGGLMDGEEGTELAADNEEPCNQRRCCLAKHFHNDVKVSVSAEKVRAALGHRGGGHERPPAVAVQAS
jgi:hypothetical protein